MAGIVLFVLFLGAILAGGFALARKNARSTPARRMMFDAGQVWDRSTPVQRAKLLSQAGIAEGTPNFTAYLVSSWKQLDFRLSAVVAAVIQASIESK